MSNAVVTKIENILNILGQSGHFYRIVSEGFCVPKEGCKLFIQVQGIINPEEVAKIKNLGFQINYVSEKVTYFKEI